MANPILERVHEEKSLSGIASRQKSCLERSPRKLTRQRHHPHITQKFPDDRERSQRPVDLQAPAANTFGDKCCRNLGPLRRERQRVKEFLHARQQLVSCRERESVLHLSNATVRRSIATFELLYPIVHQLPRDQQLTSSFLGRIKIRPIFDMSSTSGVFSHQNFTLELKDFSRKNLQSSCQQRQTEHQRHWTN